MCGPILEPWVLQCLLCCGSCIRAPLQEGFHKVLGFLTDALPIGAIKVKLVGEDATPVVVVCGGRGCGGGAWGVWGVPVCGVCVGGVMVYNGWFFGYGQHVCGSAQHVHIWGVYMHTCAWYQSVHPPHHNTHINPPYLTQRRIVRTGAIIIGKAPSQQLVRHHPSRPHITGR